MKRTLHLLVISMGILVLASGCQVQPQQADQTGSSEFKGKIALDIRESAGEYGESLGNM